MHGAGTEKEQMNLTQAFDNHEIMVLETFSALRAIVSNYREPVDSCKNSNFLFFHQKIPLGKLFSKTIFKGSSKSPVWRKIEKFEI